MEVKSLNVGEVVNVYIDSETIVQAKVIAKHKHSMLLSNKYIAERLDERFYGKKVVIFFNALQQEWEIYSRNLR